MNRILLALAGCCCSAAGPAFAQQATCDRAGIGAATLSADAPVTILATSVEQLPDRGGRYCLVQLRVGGNVNILAGLPMDGRWNGNIQAEGKGGYGGRLVAPVSSVARGFVGVQTDTGHPVAKRDPDETPAEDWQETSGAFAMQAPGVPNIPLQQDYAHRASHLMALVSKQLAVAFYGRAHRHAYWNGCSTEGRQGLRAAQQYPEDYDGILAGDPPIHFAQVMAFQIWPQVVMKQRVGHPILAAKLDLATVSAVRACDAIDGLRDGLLTDPRRCRYSAGRDRAIIRKSCTADDDACLTPTEARAIDEIWRGPIGSDGRLLWRGIERGAPLGLLAGAKPFPYAIVQPRYWVFLDPSWDWRTLSMETFPAFFARSIAAVNPVLAADNPNLRRFFGRGGKILMYHGFNDAGILPQGSIDYTEAVARTMRASPSQLADRLQLIMLPGVGHCGGGDAPQPPVDQMLDALVDWVERGRAPEGLTATQHYPDGHQRSRPLCAFPALPRYRGSGNPDGAANFVCAP